MPNLQRVVEKARRLAELGADHILLHDPAGALDPGTCGHVLSELREASGVPVGLYCQGTGGNALAMAIEAARLGAEPIAAAVLPVAYTLHRVAAEVLCDALTGLGLEHGVDAERVWEASRFIDDHVTSQMPALPIPPRITLRTAFNRLPVGLVGDLDARLRMLGAPRPAGRGAGGVQAGADRLRHAAAGPAGGRHPGRPGGAPRALRAALGRGVGRHGRVPLRRLRQPAPGDRAGGGGARRAAGRSSSRPSTTWRWREPRASPPARRTCFWSRCSGRTRTACCSPSATAASATTSSATASSAPSRNASAS